ncbi:methionyl-tRNA formyltransferase [Erysipelothrix sp. HDW6A]|uniref:methionyl-tRNA formyltransferase n=1 Tax=Erysipelothrix sp. HDW6A TaxID=2714928 RepID=UPI00351AF154
MIAKQSVSIEDKDTMGDVEAKLMKASQVLIHEDLKKYLAGELTSIEQDEPQVTLAYTIKKEDEFISFNRHVKDVYNHIRGLVPWPVGYGILDEKRVKLHAAEYQHKKVNEPAGTILKVTTEGIEVACIDGVVILKRLQTEGKQAMDVKDIANGVGRDWTGKVFL